MNGLCVVLLLILIYILYTFQKNQNEYFDTYKNHNKFSNFYYNKHNPKIFKGNLDNAKTDLYSQYMWNTRDTTGMKLYDHYYEDLNNCNYANVDGLYEYKKGERDDPYIHVHGQKISLNQGNY